MGHTESALVPTGIHSQSVIIGGVDICIIRFVENNSFIDYIGAFAVRGLKCDNIAYFALRQIIEKSVVMTCNNDVAIMIALLR